MQSSQSLFNTALRRIAVLVGMTAVGAGIGWGASHLDTPKWKAEAQLQQPSVLELGNYHSLSSMYDFIRGGASAQSGDTAANAEQSDNATETAYDAFKRTVRSPDVLVNFLSQTETVKLKAQAENQAVSIIAQQVAGEFGFENADVEQPFDRLSVTSTNPEAANKLLNEFLIFANAQTRSALNAELVAKWKVLFQRVKTAAENKLGATHQGSQIAAEDWDGKLRMMRSVQPLDDSLVAYRLAKAPSVPMAPVSPERPFWALVGGLIGLFLSLFMLPSAKQKATNNAE